MRSCRLLPTRTISVGRRPSRSEPDRRETGTRRRLHRHLDHSSHARRGAIERETVVPSRSEPAWMGPEASRQTTGQMGVVRGDAGIVRPRRSARIRKRSHGALSENPYPCPDSPSPSLRPHALALRLGRRRQSSRRRSI